MSSKNLRLLPSPPSPPSDNPLLHIADLRPGMLVDWDKLPERMYRCKVLEVQPRYGTVRIETVTRAGKHADKPLYDQWVGIAQLRPVGLATDWWRRRDGDDESEEEGGGSTTP